MAKSIPKTNSLVNTGVLTGSPPSNGAQHGENHRTYSLSIKFHDRTAQKLAFDYVNVLQHKSLTLLSNPIVVDSAIDVMKQFKGRNPTSKVRDAVATVPNIFTKDNRPKSNLHESTYNILAGISKVYLTYVKHADVLLNLLQSDASFGLSWGLLGRHPFIEGLIASKLKVSRHFARNFVFGAWRKLSPSITLPTIKENEFANLIIQSVHSYSCSGSAASKRFHKRLIEVSNDSKNLAKQFNEMDEPSWSMLKQIAKHYGRYYFSAIRYVYIQALLSKGTAMNFLGITPEMLISKPFSSQFLKLPKIQLRMGSKYVVKRAGNASVLTQLAMHNGRLEFLFPVKRGKNIVGVVEFHDSLLERLQNGAQIEVFNIWSSNGPTKMVKANVVMKNNTYVADSLVNSYVSNLNLKSESIIGLDVNGLNKHMLAFSNNVSLPSEILNLISKYRRYEDTIANRQSKMSRVRNRNKLHKLSEDVRMTHIARKRLLSEIHNQATLFTTAVIIASGATTLAIEDLSLSARGTRGILAKAILSMPDEQVLYNKACVIATTITGRRVQLRAVNPAYTSIKHNLCGGTLNRSNGSYHTARCTKCSNRVNTHLNAACNVVARASQALTKSVSTAAK